MLINCYIYMCMCVYAHVRVRVYVCAYTYVCTCACECVFVCTYTRREIFWIFAGLFLKTNSIVTEPCCSKKLHEYVRNRIHRHAHIEMDPQKRSVHTQQELQKRPVYMQQKLWKRLFEVYHYIQTTGARGTYLPDYSNEIRKQNLENFWICWY